LRQQALLLDGQAAACPLEQWLTLEIVYRYFAMLSGQGWTAVDNCRQFFYARYIDWLITFPLITTLLGFIAGSEWSVILGAIGAQCKYPLSLSCRHYLYRLIWFLHK
jgi:bacteriorhodopsin